MTGPRSGEGRPTTLLADASVLIDYRNADLAILALVSRHLGPLVVVSSVLEEVRELTAEACARLGIQIVEASTEQQDRAKDLESRISFNDRVCLVVCGDEGWTCATNDRALQRLCRKHGVPARFGLGSGGPCCWECDPSHPSRNGCAPDPDVQSATHQRTGARRFSGGAGSGAGKLTHPSRRAPSSRAAFASAAGRGLRGSPSGPGRRLTMGSGHSAAI